MFCPLYSVLLFKLCRFPYKRTIQKEISKSHMVYYVTYPYPELIYQLKLERTSEHFDLSQLMVLMIDLQKILQRSAEDKKSTIQALINYCNMKDLQVFN